MATLRDPWIIAIIVVSVLNIGLMQLTQYPALFGVRIREDLPKDPVSAHLMLSLVPTMFFVMWRIHRLALRALELKAQAEQEAMHIAMHDALTGLGNRRKFMSHLDQLRRRIPPPGIAVVLVDLDGFKAVNDTHGHDAGDGLLRVIADRMTMLTPDGAICTRLGGDEFAIVIDNGATEDLQGAAERLAARICETVRQPVMPPDKTNLQLHVSASVGVACLAQAADHVDILRAADSAMYAAKTAGKNGWRNAAPSAVDAA